MDYDRLSVPYSAQRRPDPRIAATIDAALGNARTVLNIGAGTGSYEPPARHVIAVEPSATMRQQRPPTAAPAIIGRAESLPLDDRSVDASMAVLTVHQWRDRTAGLRELLRVTRGPIVLVTFDPEPPAGFWLMDYVPELVPAERDRSLSISHLVETLSPPGRSAVARPVPIPADCADGFTEAYYARPERFLDPAVTAAQSVWNFVGAAVLARFRTHLADDLATGEWDRKYGVFRTMPTFHGSLRLVVSSAASSA